jgi:hypothetical protein
VAVREVAVAAVIVCVARAVPLNLMTFSVAVGLKPDPVNVSVKLVAPAGPLAGVTLFKIGVTVKVVGVVDPMAAAAPTLTVTV